jgi:hypothetical protein
MSAPTTTVWMLAAGLCFVIGSVLAVRGGGLTEIVDGVRESLAHADWTALVQKEPGALFERTEADIPFIASLDPNSGPVGTAITILGKGFTSRNNNIRFQGARDFLADSPVSSESGTTLHFIVTPCPSREPKCPTFFVDPGSYSVVVINANGKSNEGRFTVTRP